MTKELVNRINKEREQYLNELIEFLKIPSISSISDYQPAVQRCSNWLVKHFKSIGIEDARAIQTPGHPIVFAQWLEAGKNAPTVLVYGHYDVQPVDPLELWKTPPFEPIVSKNKIYARGTSDDKGQLFTHIKAVEAHLKTFGKLPVNIKFLIEGEEEAGSSHLDEFIEQNSKMLACDAVLISDTEWFADGMPSICYGLRGISYLELTVTGANRDLHSGTYGGAIDNPINVLCWMIAQLKDNYGRVRIPHFYDDVIALTDLEREEYLRLPFDEKQYCMDLNIKGINGEWGYTTLERVWARPALDVNGIIGGYTGEGAKTVLPSKATAKLSMRLVPNQKADKISELTIAYLKEITPPTVDLTIKYLHGGNPVMVPIDSPVVDSAKKAMKQAFGKEPVFMREGGSIPIVETFKRVLNAPTVLMGLGLPGDNIHSPNENLDLNNFYGGILASALFLFEFKKNYK